MNEIQKYISENESKMLEDLFSLIRIPSISAKPEHHDDMLACAERWAQLLLEAGADEALVMPSKGNPIVFGQKIVDPAAKTVLVYAHYDVMPAEPLELWKSNPFEPEVRDGGDREGGEFRGGGRGDYLFAVGRDGEGFHGLLPVSGGFEGRGVLYRPDGTGPAAGHRLDGGRQGDGGDEEGTGGGVRVPPQAGEVGPDDTAGREVAVGGGFGGDGGEYHESICICEV